MKMYTNKIIVEGTNAEIASFIDDFKEYFTFNIVDDDSSETTDKRLIILELLDGQNLVIDKQRKETNA